jgi:malate synthase
VAHPDLVSHVRTIFEERLGKRSHQKEQMREEISVSANQLLDFRVPDGKITEAGLRANINIALQYLDSWLNGNGAAAINNLMEDTATAEISRAQIWQWIHHQASFDDGRTITAALYEQIRDEELNKLFSQNESRYQDAAEILNGLILRDDFVDFLTLPAMKYL